MRAVVLVVAGLVLSACGADVMEGTTTTMQVTTTVTNPTTTTVPLSTTTSLPGEPIVIGPTAGDHLMVVGVAHDDVLNLRAAPGPDQEIVATIEPTVMHLAAQGATRQIPGALWVKIDFGGTQGWVNLRYVGYEGATDDLTSAVVADLGEYPTSSTMSELGLIVAESMASEDPKSAIVLVVDETVGDLGEVTYDVIGLGDDSVLGVRAHIFGEPVAGGFTLKSVEVTIICGRGVTEEGLCI